jgi:uncharacterized protein (DUF433 family)
MVRLAKVGFDRARVVLDPREMPAYGIPVAAHYLRLPASTLRDWVLGKEYETKKGRARFKPPIDLADKKGRLLSFFNLTEAHVLRAFRTRHGISLKVVRSAIDFLRDKYASPHPLLEPGFRTDGYHLFIERLRQVVDVSGHGQLVFPEIAEHFDRLEYENNQVKRFFPFTRPHGTGPKTMFIDPTLSFGRPVLASICVPTATIAGRLTAGESVQELADDYACSIQEIEEAIRCEFVIKTAA